MDNQPKISLPEAFFLVSFALIADLINWIPYINFVVTAMTLPAFQLYFYFKGINGVFSLAGNLIDAIPFASIVPSVTAGVLATIIMDRKQAMTAPPQTTV